MFSYVYTYSLLLLKRFTTTYRHYKHIYQNTHVIKQMLYILTVCLFSMYVVHVFLWCGTYLIRRG